ncbi:hypothetical protein [Streptococcus sp. sy018]|uniref:hypothetical protein n=1 Tax=Streptococcus sp. sy018 TaxID=2600147 RepID=UPI0011B70AC2|nr:hypothetical protein [Streptococcus sp. sy018]TWS94902.1 hypothetical protein FRX52_02985 [Streptococcus sp. sy018]
MLERKDWSSWQKRLLTVVILASFSFLLCLPQALTREVTMGADSIFHYNRFYEAAMQIKNHNFSYFISLYGYQQSGRIVNALYGPYFAYFQGFLVLLGRTWFGYHILSRTLLGFIAGSSLYLLMRRLQVAKLYALLLSLFFMTTYAIQYWTILQGFSSWGAAFFPLGLLGVVDLFKHRKANLVLIASSMGLMLQIHVLSTLFLSVIYMGVGTYILLVTKNKWHFIKTVIGSVFLFLVMTANVWLPLIQLNLANELIQPYINKKMVEQTITGLDRAVLVSPWSLLVLLVAQVIHFICYYKRWSSITKALMWIYLSFLILSSGLFPWFLLAGRQIAIVDLIQFPTRFFFYAIPLLLVVVGLQLSQSPQKYFKTYRMFLLACLVIGLSYTWKASWDNVVKNYRSDTFLQTKVHTTLFGESEAIRRAYHDENLKKLLELVNRSTPDYLPKIKKPTTPNGLRYIKESRYDLYEKFIILDNLRFDKAVEGKNLIVTWQTNNQQSLNLPVVVYRDTQLTLNGKKLATKDYQLNVIGTPTVLSQKGTNQLLLSYQEPWWLWPSLVLSSSSCIILILMQFKKIRFTNS